MYRYSIYGVIIESAFRINLLQPAKEDYQSSKLITIKEDDIEEDVRLFLKESNASDKQYEIGLKKSAMENIGGFYLIEKGQILVKLKDGYTYETIAPWILGYCLSMALLQMGILTIHCSALSEGEDAILISGTPGAGKSSLAGKLMDQGFKLMADDVAAVCNVDDTCIVYPAFPYQKLCANEIEKRKLNKENLIYINEDKDKYLVPVGSGFESEPKKLKTFFFIIKAPVNKLSVQKLSGFDCFMAIKENLFLHRLKGAWTTLSEVINQCMKIAAGCQVYLVTRPENIDTLDALSKKVLEIIFNITR